MKRLGVVWGVLVAALVIYGVVWSLTRGEDTTVVEIGTATFTVPSDIAELPPKESLVILISAYADSAGLTDDAKQCFVSETEKVPESEVERIDRLEGDARAEAQLEVARSSARGCIESGDNVVREDATAEQVATLKETEGRGIAAVLKFEGGFDESQTRCVVNRFRGLPDDEVIEFLNTTRTKQLHDLRRWVSDCR